MALDLDHQVPRSPFDKLEGFAWLPRMIDKARAMYAGTLGPYSAFPCPGDRGFLKHFGLDAEPLGELIKGGASDEEIAAWVVANAKEQGDAAKEAFYREQVGPHSGLFFPLVTKFLAWKNRHAIAARGNGVDWRALDSIPKVIAAEEGHPLP